MTNRLVDRTGDWQCISCARVAGEYAIWPRGKIPGFACSIECAHLAYWVREKTVSELNDLEKSALGKASDFAGEYLDELGKTDMAQMTREEWATFLEKVLLGFSSGLRSELKSESRIAPPY